MKVKQVIKSILRKEEYTYDVFGIYWGSHIADARIIVTHFFVINPNWSGMSVLTLDEVYIEDNSINFRSVFHKNNMPGIFHWALIEKELLDGVVNNDPECYEEFLSIVRSEGLINW